MTEAIIFKGKNEVITLPQNRHKAERLYEFVAACLKLKVDSVRFVGTNEDDQPSEKITTETAYIIGHSMGANRILIHCSAELLPSVRDVVLFDPSPVPAFQKRWEQLHANKLMFASDWGAGTELGGDYSRFAGVIQVEDDHYFNKSFDIIRYHLSSLA